VAQKSDDAPAADVAHAESEKPRHVLLSVNQVVAFNLMRARRRKGWTQEETAERLAAAMNRRWTNATLSAAERSWQTGRTREFNADELFAFAEVFSVPVPFFFLPPEPEEVDADAVHINFAKPPDSLDGEEFPAFLQSFGRMPLLLDGLGVNQPADYLDRVQAAFAKADISYTPPRVDTDAAAGDLDPRIFAGLKDAAVRAQQTGGATTYLSSLRKLERSFQQVIAELEELETGTPQQQEGTGS
jgi:transcriptional regulator with XRE-family HTH domain